MRCSREVDREGQPYHITWPPFTIFHKIYVVLTLAVNTIGIRRRKFDAFLAEG